MYNEKLAVALKSAGKVLRENKDTVYLPFGSEYSILIKNLNSVRVLAKVSIDGQLVDDSGDGFVIDANSSLDLERFIKNGNLNSGNRFKFIERTGKIEDHRGIQVEDGLVRVEFQFEKRPAKVEEVHTYHHHHYDHWYWDRPYIRYLVSNNSSGCFGSGQLSSTRDSSAGVSADMMNVSTNVGGSVGSANAFVSSTPTMDNLVENEVANDAGITVAGSKSEQEFVTVGSFPLEEASHVIVLKLLGETSQGKKIKQAVTVKTKQKCPTCGHMNKATSKFCTECGTALEIV